MGMFFNKGVAALVAAAAVFLVSLMVLSVLRKAFERYQERYVVKSMRDLSEMFLFVDPRQLLLMNLGVTILFLMLGVLFFGTFFTIVLGILGFFVPPWMVKFFRKRRIKKFNVQLMEALNAMSNAFKAGLNLPQAMEHIANESPAPLAQEFLLFVREIKVGKSLEDALNDMASRVGSDDLSLMVTATNIARQLGGNMAEMFDTIASTIRERFRLEGRIAALTAQGRLQGWIVAALPFALGLGINYLRPDLMEPMFDGYYGYVLLGMILLMNVMGLMLIRKITNINV